MEGLNTNDLLCCIFCSASRLILNAWEILAFCGRILGQLCINFDKSDGCVIDKCCLRHCHRGSVCTVIISHDQISNPIEKIRPVIRLLMRS